MPSDRRNLGQFSVMSITERTLMPEYRWVMDTRTSPGIDLDGYRFETMVVRRWTWPLRRRCAPSMPPPAEVALHGLIPLRRRVQAAEREGLTG